MNERIRQLLIQAKNLNTKTMGLNDCTMVGTAVACAIGLASWAWAPDLTQIMLPGVCFALGVLACLVWQSQGRT